MQAFNLTRLNFHSPYKVWIDNGSYKFLTDYGVQYRIEFVENNNIWEDEKAYEFGILNENKKISPNDSKVKATIQCIIEEFFLTNPDILLYQCETGDSRQAMFEILMSLSVSLIQSPNNSSKSAINLVDKGLYATMNRWRIDP